MYAAIIHRIEKNVVELKSEIIAHERPYDSSMGKEHYVPARILLSISSNAGTVRF